MKEPKMKDENENKKLKSRLDYCNRSRVADKKRLIKEIVDLKSSKQRLLDAIKLVERQKIMRFQEDEYLFSVARKESKEHGRNS